MKQPDGGFTVCEGGEEDIRGAYCSMTIISLLNLPLELPPGSPARIHGNETFLTGLAEWVGRCQTFEGGIAGYPGNEAHGAYAFCALACLSIIGPPSETIPRYLHLPSLISWISSRQYSPESGFSGRANKLVDGCYSHWVGGCFSLVSASLHLVTTDLWSREGLTRYIHCCAQNFKMGGLRDKPSKRPDSYHSCYNLAGLSAAQNIFEYDEDRLGVGALPLMAPYQWKIARKTETSSDDPDQVVPIHPVLVVGFDHAKACREYFEEHVGF